MKFLKPFLHFLVLLHQKNQIHIILNFVISLFMHFFFNIFLSFKYSINCFKLSTGNISNPSTIAASLEFFLDNIILFIPNFFASIHIGNTPFIFQHFHLKKVLLQKCFLLKKYLNNYFLFLH